MKRRRSSCERVASEERHGLRAHQLAEQELAGAVDHVEQHHQDGNQQQVAITEHEGKAVAPADRGFALLLSDRVRAPDLAPVDHDDHAEAGGQQDRREDHQRPGLGGGALDQRRCRLGPEPRPERTADADEREQAPPLAFRVEVVGEGPELRNREDVVDAEPDVEGHGDDRAGGVERGKRQQVDAEERRRHADEWHARHARGEPAVGRHHAKQQDGLAPLTNRPSAPRRCRCSG